ncbi:hypothetical protein PTKIN_Ptkin15bG0177300 [Pterospermum kingtungense]
MVTLLLDTSQTGAKGSLVEELSGTTIIADNMELEFLMDSEISRKLASSPCPYTNASKNPKRPASCGRGKQYPQCPPCPNPHVVRPQHCGPYTRGCR